jgi:hypothetical protein
VVRERDFGGNWSGLVVLTAGEIIDDKAAAPGLVADIERFAGF